MPGPPLAVLAPARPATALTTRLFYRLLVAMAALAVMAAVLVENPNDIIFVLHIATLALLVWVIYDRVASGRFDFFEPINFFVLAYGMMFPVDAIAFYADPSKFYDHTVAIRTSVLSLLGCLAFLVSYRFPLPGSILRQVPVLRPQMRPGRLLASIGALAVTALGCEFYLVQLAGGFQQYISQLSGRITLQQGNGYVVAGAGMANVIFVLASVAVIRRRRYPVWFWCVAAASAAMGLISGSRMGIIAPALEFMAIRHYIRTRLTWRLAGALVAALLVFTVVYGIQREVFGSGHWAQDLGSWDQIKTYVVNDDISLYERFQLIAEESPVPYPYLHGYTYYDLLVFPIPRAWWSAKPDAPGTLYTKTFWPGVYQGGTDYAISMPGELYYNFGPIGVILGMAVFGWTFSTMYAIVKVHPWDAGTVALFAGTLTALLGTVKGGVMDFVITVGLYIPPLFLALWFSVGWQRTEA